MRDFVVMAVSAAEYEEEEVRMGNEGDKGSVRCEQRQSNIRKGGKNTKEEKKTNQDKTISLRAAATSLYGGVPAQIWLNEQNPALLHSTLMRLPAHCCAPPPSRNLENMHRGLSDVGRGGSPE